MVHDAFNHALVVTAVLLGISLVIVLLFFLISYKRTGGRGFLFKFIQDYGYDDFRTIDMLKIVMKKELVDDMWMSKNGKLYIWHEIGNKFCGTYQDVDEIEPHKLVITCDGWNLQYQIDDRNIRTIRPRF